LWQQVAKRVRDIEREKSDGVLPTAALALALVSHVAMYGQPNRAGSDDNLEQLSTNCLFSKIPYFLIFASICVSVIWATRLISFLLSICLARIK
jgi:hypothetical protein